MTLLTVVFAAAISTILWYRSAPESVLKLGVLCLIYWGAALMWLADALFAYAELRDAYFTPAPADMLNDFYLGLSAVALGLVIWLVYLLVKDPKGVLKKLLLKKAAQTGALSHR